MGKSTISMVIFNTSSYVKLPEGIIPDSVQDSVATADLTAAAPDKASKCSKLLEGFSSRKSAWHWAPDGPQGIHT